MNCDWEETDRGLLRRTVRCTRCGQERSVPHASGDNIRRPCAVWPRWWELGYILEFGLAVLGINQTRFNHLRRLCGFTKPCKCGEKICKLNESGGWLRDRLAVVGAVCRIVTG